MRKATKQRPGAMAASVTGPAACVPLRETQLWAEEETQNPHAEPPLLGLTMVPGRTSISFCEDMYSYSRGIIKA